MSYLQTVLGRFDTNALEHGQIHEHIFTLATPMSDINPALRADSFEKSLSELILYRQSGGSFICDAQPLAAGRDAQMLSKLSAESGVAITASTGYHLLGFYPDNSWLHALEEDELFELFCLEIKKGMLPKCETGAVRPRIHTDICAGMIKAAIPKEGAIERYEVLFRAASQAAAYTGVPLMLHTEAGEGAVDAIKLAISLGVNPQKMVICHVDRQASDFAKHEAIAQTGVYLDYDTIARFKYHSDEDEVKLIKHMILKGYESSILLALDTTAARLSSYGGSIGLNYILDTFIPMLRAKGVSDHSITCMTVSNLKELFKN